MEEGDSNVSHRKASGQLRQFRQNDQIGTQEQPSDVTSGSNLFYRTCCPAGKCQTWDLDLVCEWKEESWFCSRCWIFPVVGEEDPRLSDLSYPGRPMI